MGIYICVTHRYSKQRPDDADRAPPMPKNIKTFLETKATCYFGMPDLPVNL